MVCKFSAKKDTLVNDNPICPECYKDMNDLCQRKEMGNNRATESYNASKKIWRWKSNACAFPRDCRFCFWCWLPQNQGDAQLEPESHERVEGNNSPCNYQSYLPVVAFTVRMNDALWEEVRRAFELDKEMDMDEWGKWLSAQSHFKHANVHYLLIYLYRSLFGDI